MGRKLLGVARFATVAVLAFGALFIVVAFTMPGDPAAGTPRVAAAVSEAAAPDKPSYLADVPAKPAVIVPSSPSVQTVASAQLDITSTPAASEADPADPNAYQIAASALNIREQPTSQSATLFVLEKGDFVNVAERDGSWAQVVDSTGRTGWAFMKYLQRPANLADAGSATASD